MNLSIHNIKDIIIEQHNLDIEGGHVISITCTGTHGVKTMNVFSKDKLNIEFIDNDYQDEI